VSVDSIAGAVPLPSRGDETALIAAAAAGDGDAYGRLVRQYEGVAYRVAAAVAGSAADGQEAVQNAYLRAYRSLGRFKQGAPFRPWLLKIVVNEARNVRRSEERHGRLRLRAATVSPVPEATPHERAGELDDVTAVLAGLAQLSVSDRMALALRYFADLPDREASAVLGVPEATYRVRVLRALRRLRAHLGEDA
jgi:RNA polymerase sigma factor (sigma-70 family)